MRRSRSTRRRLQFSLRMLFLLVTLSALGSVLLGQVIRNHEQEQRVLARISKVGQFKEIVNAKTKKSSIFVFLTPPFA